MLYVSRAQWGARSPRREILGTLGETSTGHWNGPRVPDVPHDRCASLVRGIQNFHMDGRGWNDIAYNFLVCAHGYVFEGRGINRWNGANGTNHGNRSSHAIMVLAGTGNAFTFYMRAGFRDAVAHVAARSSAPAAPVRGHRDHKSTECPGDEIYKWIHAGMPMPVALEPAPIQQEDDSMAAALIRAMYNLARRKNKDDFYDVEKHDVQGYISWNAACLKSGNPIDIINNHLAPALERETGRKLPRA